MNKLCFPLIAVPLLLAPMSAQGRPAPPEGRERQEPPPPAPPPLVVDGVVPAAAVMADGADCRSEAAIGAIVPWAGRLWAIASARADGDEGLGLYEIGADLRPVRRPESVTGSYANRLVHWESDQVFLGPHAIKADGTVRTLHRLKDHEIAATARHLKKPQSKVYHLTARGLLFEVDIESLGAQQLVDLTEQLGADGGPFTAACTVGGRLVVARASGSSDEGEAGSGVLAEWDGATWRVIERASFAALAAAPDQRSESDAPVTLYAVGSSPAAVVLRVLHAGAWSRYLLPRGSWSFESSAAGTARIGAASSGRLLLDAYGLFYDLPLPLFGGRLPALRPIAAHAGAVTDFCHYRGLLVLAGSQTDASAGQPQSNLRFACVDDLWRMGKPSGCGGPWWDTQLEEGAISDPFLMAGFDRKVLHLSTAGAEQEVRFDVEIDFRGDGSWVPYAAIVVPPSGHAHHVFPNGFSAPWLRLRAGASCRATTQLIYH